MLLINVRMSAADENREDSKHAPITGEIPTRRVMYVCLRVRVKVRMKVGVRAIRIRVSDID